jgi:hypothetical protein
MRYAAGVGEEVQRKDGALRRLARAERIVENVRFVVLCVGLVVGAYLLLLQLAEQVLDVRTWPLASWSFVAMGIWGAVVVAVYVTLVLVEQSYERRYEQREVELARADVAAAPE